MKMIPVEMASKLIDDMSKLDATKITINDFYNSICDYVANNAEVIYNWNAINPDNSTPDPEVNLIGRIITNGSLKPTNTTDTESTLSELSRQFNEQISNWRIEWLLTDVNLEPAFIIPSVVITTSRTTDRLGALTHLCTNIIDGIKLATQIISGSHNEYIGEAKFVNIL